MDETARVKEISQITDIKELKFDIIFEHCKRSIADLEWLNNTMNLQEKNAESGKPQKITFIQLRKIFVEKYLPHLMPKKKDPKPTMFEQVNAEYKRQLAEKMQG